MKIEIVDGTEGRASIQAFPPNENYIDLRQNPHALERVAGAREYLPLRNFLTAVNSPESVFASSTVATESNSPASSAAGGEIQEFGSRICVVFAEPSLNFDRSHYMELIAGLKELLERDPGESVVGTLRVFSCDFLEQKRRGFCLEIQLLAKGDSPRQAELRWGLGLARVQQALLFRARSLGQQIGA